MRFPRYSLRTLLAIVAIPAAVFLAGKFFLAALGESDRGYADAPGDIPHVGVVLDSFTPTGKTLYSCFRHPHGGCWCTISGVASRDSVQRLCDSLDASMSLDGTEIADPDWILERVDDAFAASDDIHDWSGFEITDETLLIYASNEHVHRLFGVYNPATSRFAIGMSVQ